MQKLLIVGGGYTSIDLAYRLKHKFLITIIEPNKDFLHYIGSLRGFVNAEFEKKLHFSYKNYNVIHSFVKSVDFVNHTALLNYGELFKYDLIVIATGVKHGVFSNHKLSSRIANSNKILIEGGGPIGIELAGEIHYSNPNKEITLLHNKELLLDQRYNNKLRIKLTELVASKINLLLYPHLVDKSEYDLVIKSYGLVPNTTFIDKQYIDLQGYIRVNNNLSIINTVDAYSIGDCNDIELVKTLINGYRQSSFLANYLINKRGVYRPVKEQILAIPFGPNEGFSSVYFGIVAGSTFTRLVKGIDLKLNLISKYFD